MTPASWTQRCAIMAWSLRRAADAGLVHQDERVHFQAVAGLYDALADGADPADAYASAVLAGAHPLGAQLAVELVAGWLDEVEEEGGLHD